MLPIFRGQRQQGPPLKRWSASAQSEPPPKKRSPQKFFGQPRSLGIGRWGKRAPTGVKTSWADVHPALGRNNPADLALGRLNSFRRRLTGTRFPQKSETGKGSSKAISWEAEPIPRIALKSGEMARSSATPSDRDGPISFPSAPTASSLMSGDQIRSAFGQRIRSGKTCSRPWRWGAKATYIRARVSLTGYPGAIGVFRPGQPHPPPPPPPPLLNV